jgi:catechol 2,3-dioxygenase-like lactoylglutathione lyase family enzyme
MTMGEYRGQRGVVTMIYGGNATVYVSDIDKAVRFYSEVLGLKLTNRFGNYWATVQAGNSLVIGLHPLRTGSPAPGTRGSVQIGLVLTQDHPIGQFADRLRKHGVDVSEIIESEAGNFVSFEDFDGNPIYVGDWDPDFDGLPRESLEEKLARQHEEAASAALKA